MLPLLTFASGLVAGIVGIRMLKAARTPDRLRSAGHTLGDKARHGLDQAQAGLRGAAVSGLTAIEKTSASLRGKLEPAAEAAVPEAGPDAAASEPADSVAEPVAAEAAIAEAPPAEAEAKPARKRAARPARPAEDAAGEPS